MEARASFRARASCGRTWAVFKLGPQGAVSDSIREMLCLGSMSLLKPFGASIELEVLKMTGVLGPFPLHSASYGFRRRTSPSKWSDLLIQRPSCTCAGRPQPAGNSSPQQVVLPKLRRWGASGRARCVHQAEHWALQSDLSPLTWDEPCRTRGSSAWATRKGTRHP